MVSSLNLGKSFLHLYCTEKVVSCNNFCFSTTSTFCHQILFSKWTTIISLPGGSRRKQEKEALTTALNSKLPKSVQPAPLEPAKVLATSVEDMGTPIPSFDAPSNVAASTAAYPDEGYDYRDRYRGYQATRYNSSQVDDREHHARAKFRYQRLRPDTWTRIRRLTAILTHTAKAFVRPMKRHRERAKRRRHLTAWSASSNALSAPQVLPPSSFSRLSVRVS
jgi:hypothetical protein